MTELVIKWMCSNCGGYNECEDIALRCCATAYKCSATKEEWEKRDIF